MRVIVRADAGPRIGGGHVMRCLTLANALSAESWEIVFVAAGITSSLAERIAASGHELLQIPALPGIEREGPDWHEQCLSEDEQHLDADATRAAAGRADCVIVDHYLLDAHWHRAAQSFASQVMVIDDLANRAYECDLLLDQTLGRRGHDYRSLVPDRARVLAGPAFALLRPEFARERRAALDGRRETRPVARILVSFGTTDPEEITARLVNDLLLAAPNCLLDVVVGADAPANSPLGNLASEHRSIRLHVETNRMAELMRDADLAVGACGATSWERCCLGLPSISILLADNQQMVAAALEKAGAHILVGRNDALGLTSAVQRLLSDTSLRQRMSAAAFSIVDGHGTGRVVATMRPNENARPQSIVLRPATPDDIELLWLWRNDPMTREQSRERSPIEWADHERWFDKALADPAKEVMIAMSGPDQPIGMIRFDARSDEDIEVSIAVAPHQRGKGIGSAILRAGCQLMSERRLIANLRDDNDASRAIFERCGFRLQANEAGFLRYVLERGCAAVEEL